MFRSLEVNHFVSLSLSLSLSQWLLSKEGEKVGSFVGKVGRLQRRRRRRLQRRRRRQRRRPTAFWRQKKKSIRRFGRH